MSKCKRCNDKVYLGKYCDNCYDKIAERIKRKYGVDILNGDYSEAELLELIVKIDKKLAK